MSNRFPPLIRISHPVVDGDDHDLLPGGKSLPTHHDLHQHFASMIIICHRLDYDHDLIIIVTLPSSRSKARQRWRLRGKLASRWAGRLRWKRGTTLCRTKQFQPWNIQGAKGIALCKKKNEKLRPRKSFWSLENTGIEGLARWAAWSLKQLTPTIRARYC